MKAKIVEVIMTENVEGKGTPESPVHTMRRYWTLDGELIAENIYQGELVKTKIRSSKVSERLHKPDQHQ